MSGYIETFESVDDSYLEHFGVRGMKWGQRRYQNKDGSYTSAGKKRRDNYDTRSQMKSKYERSIKENKKTLSEELKDLKELEKYGKHSNAFKKDKKDRSMDNDPLTDDQIFNNLLNKKKDSVKNLNYSIDNETRIIKNIKSKSGKNKDFYDYRKAADEGAIASSKIMAVVGGVTAAVVSKTAGASVGRTIVNSALGAFGGVVLSTVNYQSDEDVYDAHFNKGLK